MGIYKGKFRILGDGQHLFWCKPCDRYHGVYVTKDKPVNWDFNGDYDKPTLSPSVLVSDGHGHICHSCVRDGQIQYLNDCTHVLAGQTVNIEEAED